MPPWNKLFRNLVFAAICILMLGSCREDPVARDAIYWLSIHERSNAGLNVFGIDDYLEGQALAHSMEMCEQQRGIFHSNLAAQYGGQNWNKLGENVGSTAEPDSHRSAEEIWDMWLNSPDHRANIYGSWVHEGVGAVRCDKDGRIYFTHVFRR